MPTTVTSRDYEIIAEGMVHQCTAPDGRDLAVSSRCAVLHDGRVLCSYMLQSQLAANDFVPQLSESSDNGETWRSRGPIWPHLAEAYSINVSLARGGDGSLTLFGTQTPRSSEQPSFWCQETLGILQNKLLWSRSTDEGETWSEPSTIDIPYAGAAEAPCPMCITRDGTWVAPYSPHNTFDPGLKVDLQQVVVVISDDQGQTWRPSTMLRVTQPDAYVAEAWVTQLADGRLLGTAWHLMRGDTDDLAHACALSDDDGRTWSDPFDSGIHGQSAGSADLPDGRVLFAYNQRVHDRPGVWMAVARPEPGDFGVTVDQPVWLAPQPTQTGTHGKSAQWTDFAFGEPSVTLLDDHTALVAFWCLQPDYRGIRFVKVRWT